MHRAEVLNSAILDTPIVLTNFINIYKKHKREKRIRDYIYCFYEGKDDSKYYNSKVENINHNHKQVSHFKCDGKDKLLDLYNEIERRRQHTPVYRDGQLVYFIDKDFDDLIKQEKFKGLQEIENLYITPTYSIENFYTTLEVFQRILKSEFHLIETESDFEKLTELFLERQNEFHHIMLNVNAWIATQNYFSYTQEERNIPYNELSIDRFVKITLEKIEVKEDNMMEFLENRFQESYKMEDSEVSIKFQELKAKLFQNTQANFRGKFELEFLKKFLTRLIEKCNQKDGCGLKFIGINQKIKVQLILSDTISNLSQYADTPQCLRQFIKDNSMERI